MLDPPPCAARWTAPLPTAPVAARPAHAGAPGGERPPAARSAFGWRAFGPGRDPVPRTGTRS